MNWLPIIASTLGIGSSLLGARSQQRKMQEMQEKQLRLAQNYLNQQQQMWSPYVAAGKNSLSATQAFVNEQDALRYQEDRLAGIARDRSVAAAYQATARNNANVSAAYANNQGRALGTQLRNERSGAEAVSNANFNWALQNRSAQAQATNNYLQGLTSINNAGFTGANAMSNAYNTYTSLRSQANTMNGQASSAWQDIGGMLLGVGLTGVIDGMTGGTSKKAATSAATKSSSAMASSGLAADPYDPFWFENDLAKFKVVP